MRESGRLIGSGGAYPIYEYNCYSIGYNLAYNYRNNGYVTEAMTKIVDFCKNQLGAKRFVSIHATENPAGGRVMEKLGMRFCEDCSYEKTDGTEFKAKSYKMEV